MTRRKYIYMVVIIASVFFLSCKGKDRQQEEENGITSIPNTTKELSPTPEPAVATNIPEDNPVGESGKRISYQLTDASYEKGEINIRYPQLSGLADKDKQESVNELIRKDALKDIEQYQTENGTLEINYKVSFQGENLLSIQYIVYSSFPGATHPNHNFYTTNINLKNASRVRLADVVKINDSFVAEFKKGSKYTDPIRDADQELQTLLEDNINALTAAEIMDADGLSGDTPYYSYFTKEALGIGIEVPYAVGGYALYEISYQEILSYIISENEIWVDFPELLPQPGNHAVSSEGIPFTANSPEEFIPEGYQLCELYGEKILVKGDLNQDGVNDLALVIEGTAKDGSSAPRILIIAFSKEDGTYERSVIARDAILRSDEGGIWGDPFEGISIQKGTIHMSFYGGSAWKWANRYQFRYQENDWYLIGATETVFNVEHNVDTEKDYNLSTGAYIITNYAEDGAKTVTNGTYNKRNRYRLEAFDTGNEDIFEFEMPPSEQAGQSKEDIIILPVVAEGTLLGGFDGREWVDADGTAALLKGGEVYQLFTGYEFAGKAKGKAPEADIDFGSFYHLDMLEEVTYDLAIGSKAEVLSPKRRREEASYYKKIIQEFFREIGHPEYQISHTEGISLDLDQDGDWEDIICTYRYPKSPYYQVKAEGNYSYTLLYDNGRISIIDEAYRDIAEEGDGSEFEKGTEIIMLYTTSVLGSVDIDGDGTYEVVIGENWFEGWGYSVYEYRAGSLKKVLGMGFSI